MCAYFGVCYVFAHANRTVELTLFARVGGGGCWAWDGSCGGRVWGGLKSYCCIVIGWHGMVLVVSCCAGELSG